jgi:molybdate/tungstate transport system substrate-binding protein
MQISRRQILAASGACVALGAAPAWASGKINVVFAGSMGVVMDRGIGPAYQAKTGTTFQGIGQPAMALAHLLAAKTMVADVFVSVSPGPIKVVEEAKLTARAVPVASTEFVMAYSPKSKFAAQFAAADAGDAIRLLTAPGLRFGRTDPAADPQGAYVLYCLQLAELYYKQPGLAAKITGPQANPAQIFAEPSLLARLQDGELDATLGYESAVISQKLPYLKLPAEINFGTPSLAKDWYGKATLTLKGKPAHPGPLVFYAAILANAPNPGAAADFVAYLASAPGQALFSKYGYNPGKGAAI